MRGFDKLIHRKHALFCGLCGLFRCLLAEVREGKYEITKLCKDYKFSDEALDALMQAADDYNDARIALEILADEDAASAEEARFENEQ